MFHSSGNYEAFSRPRKPEGVENRNAYIVGGGLAGLSAAAFLVRDAQMPGENVHVLEELGLPGGACDAERDRARGGYVMRGGREMEEHFECLWDLYRSIPSLEVEGASVLDEFNWLNKDDPNVSPCRATVGCGRDAGLDKKFALSDQALKDLLTLSMTRDGDLYDKRLDEVVSPEFFDSNFWLYWCTMFGFEPWHGALEVKTYMLRFTHGMRTMPDFSSLKFTRYNEYDSLILPLVRYLKGHGVHLEYGCRVTDVEFEQTGDARIARRIAAVRGGASLSIDLAPTDLVFVTNGSCTDESCLGSNEAPARLQIASGEGASWELWRRVAAQGPGFGRPDKFCSDIDATKWESCTITTRDPRIPAYVQKITGRDPFDGRDATGGIVTVKDSSWLMSYGIKRQPVFRDQAADEMVVWVYGLHSNRPGDFVKKPIAACTGNEIVQEWLYHIGVPADQIEAVARQDAVGIPCMMPYITAFFMPRSEGDFPDVVPEGCTNFAFIGQFANVPRDPVFTTEKSVRSAMEAVYTLLDIERGVPEVFGSAYDVRYLLQALPILSDGRGIDASKLSMPDRLKLRELTRTVEGTEAEALMREAGLL